MPNLQGIGDGIAQAFTDALERARSVGAGTSRRDQLLAALLLPFFMVAAMAAAVVLKEIVLDWIPAGVPALAAIGFLAGFVIMVLTFTTCFWWVKTGGFGLFE